MLKQSLLLSLTAALFACSPQSYRAEVLPQPDSHQIEAMKNAGLERYIVESKDKNNLKTEVTSEKGVHIRQMESSEGLVVYLSPQAVEKLRGKFSDLKVEKDIEFSIAPDAVLNARPGGGGSTPPAQSVPWGISRVRASEANAVTRGAGIKVCVVDTGIDKTHSDLAGNIVGGKNYVVSRGKIDPNGWNDDNGHGSHVAGTIAAIDNSVGVIGVAPQAKLYGVKVLDSRGSGFLSDVADGINACVTAGAQVINMSLGSNGDPNLSSAMKTAVLNAQSNGVVVVVAAGNEGQDISKTIPAGYPSVIAVAAIDSSGNYPSWSNFGLGDNDYTAPGVSILSTWKSGGYNTISGTSMASPHVAGVVALKLAAAGASLVAIDLGFPMAKQGLGLIDALGSVQP